MTPCKGGAAYIPLMTHAQRASRRRRAAELAKVVPVVMVAARLDYSPPSIYLAMKEFRVPTRRLWTRRAGGAA